MLLEGEEKLKKGGETGRGGWSPALRDTALRRRPLICPTLGLWRMGWETFESQGECSRLKAPWDPGWTGREPRRRKRG